ncbi:MAG: hypothetical protein ACE5IY_11625 [bacterium]
MVKAAEEKKTGIWARITALFSKKDGQKERTEQKAQKKSSRALPSNPPPDP